jgi:hypothetical protein
MDQSKLVKKGSVCQVNPETDSAFVGCLVIVTEVKPFGVQGFVQIPQGFDEFGEQIGGGKAYIRLNWKDIEYVGEAVWTIQ